MEVDSGIWHPQVLTSYLHMLNKLPNEDHDIRSATLDPEPSVGSLVFDNKLLTVKSGFGLFMSFTTKPGWVKLVVIYPCTDQAEFIQVLFLFKILVVFMFSVVITLCDNSDNIVYKCKLNKWVILCVGIFCLCMTTIWVILSKTTCFFSFAPEIPDSLRVVYRPTCLIKPDVTKLIEVLPYIVQKNINESSYYSQMINIFRFGYKPLVSWIQ